MIRIGRVRISRSRGLGVELAQMIMRRLGAFPEIGNKLNSTKLFCHQRRALRTRGLGHPAPLWQPLSCVRFVSIQKALWSYIGLSNQRMPRHAGSEW